MSRNLLWLVLGLSGCPDLGAPLSRAPAGTISGSISYASETDRTLVVAAWDSMPPAGAPLASVTIERPTFPQGYTLSGVPAGAAFLTARLGDAAGEPAVLGSYPSVAEVSAVDLADGEGLRGADFALANEGDHLADPTVQSETRTLAGTVSFAGQVLPGDALRGALYATYPPRGAPVDFLILNVANPTFPYDYGFTGLSDGNYYAVFYLDRGGDSSFGPGYGDVVAWALGPGGTPIPATIALGASRTGIDVSIPAR